MYVSLCVGVCACVWGGNSASVLALFAVRPAPCRWECNFSDIPYLQFILRSINQPQHKISPNTATHCSALCTQIWKMHHNAKIRRWLFKENNTRNAQATYVNHMLAVSVKPYDKEQYDSPQDTQIKVIYITVKEGWICCVTFTYIYLWCSHIFMNILDNSITPALFCQKWIFHCNDTYVEIEHILQAIIIGLESEPALDSLNNEQRGEKC